MTHEELARKTAHILGPASAAALALADLDRRRAEGRDVALVKAWGAWYVAEFPPEPPAGLPGEQQE